MYAKTLTAKQDYHLLVTNLLKEHKETQHQKNAYTTLCLEAMVRTSKTLHHAMVC